VPRLPRSGEEQMEFVRIVGLSVLSACLYGIAQDQVTARVCVEYFTVGHPPIGSESPTVLGLAWGVLATWWVGLLLGVPLALVCRLGGHNRIAARQLVRPIGLALLAMALVALLAGAAGWFAARWGVVWMVEPMASRVARERHGRFLADLWAHLGAYGAGFLGGLALCAWALVKRFARRAVGEGGEARSQGASPSS